jgi:hypothetical protein
MPWQTSKCLTHGINCLGSHMIDSTNPSSMSHSDDMTDWINQEDRNAICKAHEQRHTWFIGENDIRLKMLLIDLPGSICYRHRAAMHLPHIVHAFKIKPHGRKTAPSIFNHSLGIITYRATGVQRGEWRSADSSTASENRLCDASIKHAVE